MCTPVYTYTYVILTVLYLFYRADKNILYCLEIQFGKFAMIR